MNRQPTIYLIDPDEPTRNAIKKLTSLMDLQCVAFMSGQEFFEAFSPGQPGCAIMEIKIPGMNGLQIQQRLRESGAALPVVFICVEPSVSIAVHAMRAGAVHVLEKPVRENDMWNAIQEAIQLDSRRREARIAQQEISERIASLTEKEQGVLELIADGLPKHAIAQELGVSVRTIEHHRTQLMRKLRTNSLAGLMQFALSTKNGNGSLDTVANYRLVEPSF